MEDVALGCSEDAPVGVGFVSFVSIHRYLRVDSFLQTLTSEVVEPDTVDLTEPKCSVPVGMVAQGKKGFELAG